MSDDCYKRETDALTEHLLLRGYSKTSLKKAFRRVQGRPRHELVFGCNNRPESSTVKLITLYTRKHEDLYRFIKKHWWLLSGDPLVTPHVRATPEVTYRRSTSLKDQLVHFIDRCHGERCSTVVGTFPCHCYGVCDYLVMDMVIPSLGRRRFKCKHFVDRGTAGVIYLFGVSAGVM